MPTLLHNLTIGSAPGQMLPSVDGKRDARDTFCLRQIEHCGRNVVGPRPALKRQTLCLRSELYIGLTRARQSRPWRHRIYAKLWRQRLRQRGGGRMQRSLAQGVREKARVWPKHTLVKNIDDRGIHAR